MKIRCRWTRIPIMMLLLMMLVLLLAAGTAQARTPTPTLTPVELLGKALFFDENLSQPAGQSCASCHGPKAGWSGPVSSINATTAVYPGAVSTRFGNRKPPSAAYAGPSPILSQVSLGLWIGGMFWDGRATGNILGDPLAEQAQGPFLNPLEQNNPDPASVVAKVRCSNYAVLFRKVWGAGAFADVNLAYERIARSIAAYERSSEVSPFNSRYDVYLKTGRGLSSAEKRGLALFEGKANCAGCHTSQPGPNGEPPLFTDFSYDNLGVPKNPANPFYTMGPQFNPLGGNWVDLGLGPIVGDELQNGKVKVPTLRNVDQRQSATFVKAYAHNGYFTSLKSIVHFYNTRDVAGAGWPAPEVAQNVNLTELGNLGLTDEEENDLVLFLKTLSDR